MGDVIEGGAHQQAKKNICKLNTITCLVLQLDADRVSLLSGSQFWTISRVCLLKTRCERRQFITCKYLAHANCTPFWKRRTQKTARKNNFFGHLQHAGIRHKENRFLRNLLLFSSFCLPK